MNHEERKRYRATPNGRLRKRAGDKRYRIKFRTEHREEYRIQRRLAKRRNRAKAKAMTHPWTRKEALSVVT